MLGNLSDIHSLLKATQMLSQTLERADLLAEMIKVLLEYAGTERAVILCRTAGSWFIEASGQSQEPRIQTGMHAPLLETAPLSLRAVEAAIHTGQTLALPNVPQDAQQLGSDPYLRDHRVKSLLCLPVWHKDELALLLYLENICTADAFTESYLESLHWLSDQMAISLNNALMVEGLKTSLAEREQVEQTLRQSEEQLRLVLDNMVDVISQTDPYLNVVFTTPSLERIFGYPPAEIIGKPAEGWVHPDDLKSMRQKAAVARQRYDPFVFLEYRWRRADGEYLWIESATRLLYDDQWQPRGAIFASRDITERKRMESELAAKRSAEQLFSERLATLAAVTNELSKANTLDDLCRRAVEAGRRNLGFDRVALFFVTEDYGAMLGTYGTDNEGQTTDERHERHAIAEPSGLYAVVSGAVPFRLYKNAPVYRGDGIQVGFGDRIAVGLWNGETVIGFLSVDNFIHRRSITDQDCELMRLYASALGHLCTLKRAQDELAQLAATLEQRVVERTAELEATNRELEAFSYSVSHDLRAPLRAMDGFSRILIEEYAQDMLPQAQAYLHRVRNNVQRMGELIEGLLALSRLGRQALQETYVNMQDLARQVIEELRVELDGREVEFVVDELPICHADATLLRQVLTNLIGNALKFTREQTPARIEIGCWSAVNALVYYVRDNGVGFDMHYADKLFGVFQRLHRVEDFEGTGIGLATVQRIIHRHGGRVWAEGEVGKGATFYFSLERSVER